MGVIEKHLHEHFASLEDDADVPAPSIVDSSQLRDSRTEQLDPPFAKVNSVVVNSPAETAGLRAGDLIRNFGYVNSENHDSLRKVAECVQGNEGVSLPCLLAASSKAPVYPPSVQQDSKRELTVAAKHTGEGIPQHRSWSATGAPDDVGTQAGLGRQGHARVPHPPLVTRPAAGTKLDGMDSILRSLYRLMTHQTHQLPCRPPQDPQEHEQDSPSQESRRTWVAYSLQCVLRVLTVILHLPTSGS